MLKNKIKFSMLSALSCHLNTLMLFITIAEYNRYKIQLNKETKRKCMRHGKKTANKFRKKLTASAYRICKKYMRDNSNQFNVFMHFCNI